MVLYVIVLILYLARCNSLKLLRLLLEEVLHLI
jgi:hypothetical protein